MAKQFGESAMHRLLVGLYAAPLLAAIAWSVHRDAPVMIALLVTGFAFGTLVAANVYDVNTKHHFFWIMGMPYPAFLLYFLVLLLVGIIHGVHHFGQTEIVSGEYVVLLMQYILIGWTGGIIDFFVSVWRHKKMAT